jgi:hypothetical protein
MEPPKKPDPVTNRIEQISTAASALAGVAALILTLVSMFRKGKTTPVQPQPEQPTNNTRPM